MRPPAAAARRRRRPRRRRGGRLRRRPQRGADPRMTPLLFDLDGTLVDSRVVVKRQWGRLCERLGLDFTEVLKVLHGVRSVDTIRAVAPGVDAEAEAARLDAAEEFDTDGLVARARRRRGACPPARRQLGDRDVGPATLAERRLARRRAARSGGHGVRRRGDVRASPTPRGSWRAPGCSASRPETCVAFEDAPAGIQAARAAGMPVSASRRRTRPLRSPARRRDRRPDGVRRRSQHSVARSRRAGAQPR